MERCEISIGKYGKTNTLFGQALFVFFNVLMDHKRMDKCEDYGKYGNIIDPWRQICKDDPDLWSDRFQIWVVIFCCRFPCICPQIHPNHQFP